MNLGEIAASFMSCLWFEMLSSYIYIYICVCVHVYIYIYTYIYIYMYTRPLMNQCFSPPWMFRKTTPKSTKTTAKMIRNLMTWPLAAAQNSALRVGHVTWCILFLNSHWCYPVSGCFCDLIISYYLIQLSSVIHIYNQITRCSIASNCKHATWLPPFQCFQAFALAQSIKRRSKQWCHAAELRWETRQIGWILLLTDHNDHRTYRTVGIVQELSWEINTHDLDGEDWTKKNWAVGKRIGRTWLARDKISNKSGDVGGFIQPHFGVTHSLYPSPANINGYTLYTLITIDWTNDCHKPHQRSSTGDA